MLVILSGIGKTTFGYFKVLHQKRGLTLSHALLIVVEVAATPAG